MFIYIEKLFSIFIVFDYCYIESMHGLPIIAMMTNQDKKQENDLKNIRVVPPKMGAGAKIIGNYILGKNIGEGAFGKVYMAMHWPTNEKVAVKVIDKTKIKGNDVNRVKNQIKILSTTRHRNIIHLYQIIETEKSLLLVMQFMPNGQLFRHILKQKKLEETQACSIFQQIIAAVEYLHNSKIAHRDLKPQNILIDYDNQVKIIDFGLGAIYEKSNLKSFCGSPCYAAPEIIEAKKSYNPLMADLWSCGVILYVMLAGHLPFCDQNNQAVYKKVLSGSYKIPPHISSSAKDLIEHLLLLNPAKRLSIQQIKTHDWYNIVAPKNAYGIPKDYFIEPNNQIINRLSLDISEKRKLHEGVLKDERNKLTASYNILIKKIIKKNEKIEHYIGSDFFNPSLLKKFDAKQYDDTKSNEIVIQTKPILIEVPTVGDAQLPQTPLHSESTPWTEHYVEEEIRPLNNQNTLDIFKGVINVFSGKMSKKIKVMEEIMNPNDLNEEKLQIKNKQACFYENNITLKNKFLNLEQAKDDYQLNKVRIKDKAKNKARSQLSSFQSIYRKLISSNVKRISRPNSINRPIFSDLIKYKKDHVMNEQQLKLPKVLVESREHRKISKLQLKKIQLKNIYLIH